MDGVIFFKIIIILRYRGAFLGVRELNQDQRVEGQKFSIKKANGKEIFHQKGKQGGNFSSKGQTGWKFFIKRANGTAHFVNST